jgi:hypothetical protein
VAGRRAATYDHLRSKKKPNTAKIEIILDTEVVEDLDEARLRLDAAKESLALAEEGKADQREIRQLREAITVAEEEVKEAEDAADEVVAVFKFRSLGARAYDNLVAMHPITPEQEQKIRDEGGEPTAWNPDTFPPALTQASLVEPKLTEDEFLEIWKSEDWGPNELMTLFMTALTVNSSRRQVDWGKG